MTETNHDTHTARLADVESLLQQGAESDAILLEIPLLWIIPDPDFKSKVGQQQRTAPSALASGAQQGSTFS
eukprot:4116827-Amphidinium_carterae.1